MINVNLSDLLIQKVNSLYLSLPGAITLSLLSSKLVDYLGVCHAGSKELRFKHTEYLNKNSIGFGSSTVIGLDRTAPAEVAALLNGMSSHVCEFDDGERSSLVHPGAPVISACLAVAEELDKSIDELLRAIYVGYYTAICLGRVMQPALKERGLHSTGVCGAIGATIGVGLLKSLTLVEQKTSLALACTSASGMLRVLRDSSQLKPFNAGQAASNGVKAASLAAVGYVGPMDPIGQSRGFLDVMCGDPNAELKLYKQLTSEDTLFEYVYTKYYAACLHSHSPIEAALAIRSSSKFKLSDIDKIDVITHQYAIEQHDHIIIENSASAKMSIPYAVAVALIKGTGDLAVFEPALVNNDEVKALTKKVSIFSEDSMTNSFPLLRPAKVIIHLGQGDKLEAQVDLAKGQPENPLTNDDLVAKFVGMILSSGKDKICAEKIIDVLNNTEGRVSELSPLIK